MLNIHGVRFQPDLTNPEPPTNFKENERRTVRRIPEESNPRNEGRARAHRTSQEQAATHSRRGRNAAPSRRRMARKSAGGMRERQERARHTAGFLIDFAPPTAAEILLKPEDYRQLFRDIQTQAKARTPEPRRGAIFIARRPLGFSLLFFGGAARKASSRAVTRIVERISELRQTGSRAAEKQKGGKKSGRLILQISHPYGASQVRQFANRATLMEDTLQVLNN